MKRRVGIRRRKRRRRRDRRKRRGKRRRDRRKRRSRRTQRRGRDGWIEDGRLLHKFPKRSLSACMVMERVICSQRRGRGGEVKVHPYTLGARLDPLNASGLKNILTCIPAYHSFHL